MELAKLTSEQSKQITKLLEQKESLQQELEKIDQKLTNYERGKGSAVAPAPSRKKGRVGRPPKEATKKAAKKTTAKTRKRAPRGQLKEGIINELSNAGKEGLTVKELAERLKTKPANIHAWFFTTGKRMKGIKKVGAGKYSLSGKYQ